MAGSGNRRSPYFGHEAQCYRWDNKCHCASTQPYQLPPEGSGSFQLPPEPPLTVTMTPDQIRSHYSSTVGRVQHQTTPSTTQPYQLPPEGYGSFQLPPEPPLTVTMTPEQIRSYYSSTVGGVQHQTTPSMQPLANHYVTSEVSYNDSWPSSVGEGGGWAGVGSGPVPTVTHLPGPQQWSDLPPPYESLYPSLPTREGQRPPESRTHK